MKILMICNDLQINGITNVIMNYARNIDLEKFKIEIAAGEPINEDCALELLQKGVILHRLPNRKKKTLKFYRSLSKLIKINEYDAVHMHGNSSTMAMELLIAKRRGVKVRIAHCHNSTCGSMLRHKLLLPFFRRSYTDAAACSKLAGDWIFGENKFTVLTNGIFTEDYKFNEDKRNYYRERLGVKENTVIGHVGRFNSQKNHPFLLSVFEKVLKKRPDARLLLVGNGPDFEKIRLQIQNSAFCDKVILYGESDDVSGLMSAMDIFALPSKFEGLGIVALEAQISGLPCLVSDNVPDEVVLGDGIEFLSLNNIDGWADAICSCKPESGLSDRAEYYSRNSEAISRYDVKKTVKKLEGLYSAIRK